MNATKLAEQFFTCRRRIVTWREHIHVFTGAHYERMERGELIRDIHDFIHEHGGSLDRGEINKVATAIEQLTFVPSPQNPPFRIGEDERRLLLAVKNGVLDLTGVETGENCQLVPSSKRRANSPAGAWDVRPLHRVRRNTLVIHNCGTMTRARKTTVTEMSSIAPTGPVGQH